MEGDGGISGSITGNVTGLLSFDRSDDITFSGNISGGSMIQAGSGTLTLTGTNSSGAIIENGVLAIPSDSAVGGAGAGIDFWGGTLQFNNYTSNINFPSASNLSLGAATGASSTLAGTISGSYGLNYYGPGTLLLTGTNSYSDNTVIAGGTLAIASDSALGDTPEIILNGGTLQFGASMTEGSGRTFGLASVSQIDTNGNNVEIDGLITDGSEEELGCLTKVGSGTLTVTCATSYTGTTEVVGGYPRLRNKFGHRYSGR